MTMETATLDPSSMCTDGTTRDLVGAAFRIVADHYVVERHQIGAALLDVTGAIHLGLHLDAMIGRAAICAEAVALGTARMAGNARLVAVAAVRFPKPAEDGAARIVPPCGLCRELLLDYAPEIQVILDICGGVQAVPLDSLLPHKYVGTKWAAAMAEEATEHPSELGI